MLDFPPRQGFEDYGKITPGCAKYPPQEVSNRQSWLLLCTIRITFFHPSEHTPNVSRSTRDKRTGLSNCRSTMANCLHSTKLSKSFSCSDNRPILIHSISVDNTCITTHQTIHPRFLPVGWMSYSAIWYGVDR
jgi:hypothetical protein